MGSLFVLYVGIPIHMDCVRCGFDDSSIGKDRAFSSFLGALASQRGLTSRRLCKNILRFFL